MAGKLGLKLGRHNVGLPLFSSVIAGPKLPSARPACDWLSPIHQFDMLGNDRASCCVFAATLNAIRVMAANTGRTVPDFTAKDALALYTAVAGFDPNNPATDQGSDFDAAGTYWQTEGVAGTKIISRVRVNPGNLNLIRLAIDWFGPVMVGLALTDDAEDLFDAEKPWIVTGSKPNPDKGHEVLVGSYRGDVFDAITWGKRQSMSADWLLQCTAPYLGGDIQGIVSDQWIRSNKFSPSMLQMETIRRDAGLLLAAS